MSQDHINLPVLRLGGGDRGSTLVRVTTHDYAMYEELSFARREAQAEANLAYEDWRFVACNEAYVVYRAAQDRADAAQDQLASWVQRIAV
jgi:hypothetical protein